MKTHRTDKANGHFTQVANAVIEDKRLSLQARGLMAFLLSLHPGWDLNLKGLVSAVGHGGRGLINGALSELQSYGYVVRTKRRDSAGRILPPEYEVFEEPSDDGQPQTGFPATANPATGHPAPAKPPLRNTESSNTESNNTGIDMEPLSKALPAKEEAVKVSTPITASGTDEVGGYRLTDYAAKADAAMEQNLEQACGCYWTTLDANVSKDRSFTDVFGQNPQIAWTSREYGYLKEVVQFCMEKWPDNDPRTATELLIRAAFRWQGKAHQFLRYWVDHGHSKVSLRPFLTLGGGTSDPAKRLDILTELAMDVNLIPAGK